MKEQIIAETGLSKQNLRTLSDRDIRIEEFPTQPMFVPLLDDGTVSRHTMRRDLQLA